MAGGGATVRRVVVTGANRGIGLALVRAFTGRGDEVWATCRDPAAATDLAALGPAAVVPLDLGDADSIAQAAATIAGGVDSIDVLVNNAGANHRAIGLDRSQSGILTAPATGVLEMVRVNALGPLELTRSLLPRLEAAAGGWVVNITSQLGSMVVGGGFDSFPYAASKAVMNMATAQLATKLRDRGVGLVCIHPGWVRTDMGGAHAELDADESAAGIVATLDRLGPADSGRFLRWDGSEHPW